MHTDCADDGSPKQRIPPTHAQHTHTNKSPLERHAIRNCHRSFVRSTAAGNSSSSSGNSSSTTAITSRRPLTPVHGTRFALYSRRALVAFALQYKQTRTHQIANVCAGVREAPVGVGGVGLSLHMSSSKRRAPARLTARVGGAMRGGACIGREGGAIAIGRVHVHIFVYARLPSGTSSLSNAAN